MTETPTQELVRARASIHLADLPLGHVALVDRFDPYIAEAIQHGYLVPEEMINTAEGVPGS